MSSATIQPGHSLPIYVSPAATDKYGKGASLGQYLQGTATFAKDEAGKKADVYQFKYILPDASKKKDKTKNKVEDVAAYEEALRECKISWLAKLSYKSKEPE